MESLPPSAFSRDNSSGGQHVRGGGLDSGRRRKQPGFGRRPQHLATTQRARRATPVRAGAGRRGSRVDKGGAVRPGRRRRRPPPAGSARAGGGARGGG